jgi:hypothetical protein
MMSVLTLSYSLTSSFVTTVFALLEAKEASRGNVGTFSIVLLDEGALGISITSTDGAESGSGIDGFWAGGGGGGRLLSSITFLDDESVFLFFPRVSGASSYWLIIFLNFSLFSLAVAIPTKQNEDTVR